MGISALKKKKRTPTTTQSLDLHVKQLALHTEEPDALEYEEGEINVDAESAGVHWAWQEEQGCHFMCTVSFLLYHVHITTCRASLPCFQCLSFTNISNRDYKYLDKYSSIALESVLIPKGVSC